MCSPWGTGDDGFPEDFVDGVAFADGIHHLIDEELETAAFVGSQRMGAGKVAIKVVEGVALLAGFLGAIFDENLPAVAGDQEVEGEGVVGVQPRLEPGEVHEYESYCVLRSPEGHMEGYYELVRDDGATFRAEIPRFELRAEGQTGRGE